MSEAAAPQQEPPMDATAPGAVVDQQPAAEPEMKATKKRSFLPDMTACCGCLFKKKAAAPESEEADTPVDEKEATREADGAEAPAAAAPAS